MTLDVSLDVALVNYRKFHYSSAGENHDSAKDIRYDIYGSCWDSAHGRNVLRRLPGCFPAPIG